MKTAREIRSAIVSGNFTNDELNDLIMAIRFARTQLIKTVKRNITVGDTVQYNGRNGLTRGTVEKVAIKYATVRVGSGMMWRVPMNMLNVV